MFIFNTMSKKKEEFIPIEKNKVKMYVCGPTVYNYFHIGNARPFLFFDVVRKYFNFLGYETVYIQNITDIDDKIITQAIEEKKDFKEITQKYIEAFYKDLTNLNITFADKNPRATEFVSEMIEIINSMINKKFAYEVNGDVYFEVKKDINYGKLSGKNLEDLQAGARIEANQQKRNPFDFTLWKKAKDGEPAWDSPWGKGRPGWHTECVVMSRSFLGETFDIHGGGMDLIFPHHENEIAQAEVMFQKPLANYWMHNGFLNIEGDKMSKSLNNFFTTRDVLKVYEADVIRFFFLSKHYRSPIDYNQGILEESKTAIARFYEVFRKYPVYEELQDTSYKLEENLDNINKQFIEAMDDDFNTAKAIACLFDLAKEVFNPQNDENSQKEAAKLLYKLGSVLGFFKDLSEKLTKNIDNKAEKLILLLLELRNQAKKDKNFALADKIRQELKAMGFELRDTANGTEWSLIK
ncbi:MAG: cysteine--tRNA ligase [Candidatus Cloacimonetes bacterium]|nr:cysteine--tRNA ligase [Candidatus Cloacimonadota bacterium]